MKISTSKLPAIQHQWQFGGLYFASPDKLDTKVPFVKKEVRQAMNMAINRQAIADNLLGGKVQPHRIMGYHQQLDGAIWPGIWNPDWDKRFEDLMGTTRPRPRRSWRRQDILRVLSSPCISTPCRGSQSKWISGRPWRWIFRR